MLLSKADIIAQLQRDIMPLQGVKPAANSQGFSAGLGFMRHAFPGGTFPVGAVHEFLGGCAEDASAASGFVAGLLSAFMQKGAATVWVGASPIIFPPALSLFGIPPERVIFLHIQKEKDILWAAEEALKCSALAAVVAEVGNLSFMASRRLQLAVEQSQVTGFVLRHHAKTQATACVTRWKITSLPSDTADGLPGVGFPRWNVDLLKVRNGKPGTWQMEWVGQRFRHVAAWPAAVIVPQSKAV